MPTIEREVSDLQDQVRRLQSDHDQLRTDFDKALERVEWIEIWKRARDYEE
jgi:hypothetical protein